jgi:hypothetical protein
MSTPLERFHQRQQAIYAGTPLFQEPVVEPEEEEPGFFGNLTRGVASGFLEPLGIIPGVGGFLDSIQTHPDDLSSKIGYGVGWMAGFLVPSSAAMKVGGAALKWGRLVKTADAFSDLGMAKNLARGAVAGALLGFGREAEDAKERLGNVVSESMLFGVGDAVGHLAFNAISNAASSLKVSGGLKQLLTQLENEGRAETPEGMQILARALSMTDDVVTPEVTGATVEQVGVMREKLKAGLIKSRINEIRPGVVLVSKSLDSEASHLKGVFNLLKDDLDHHVIKRKIGKHEVSDVLIAKKGELDDRLIEMYTNNLEKHGEGFIEGQVVRWKGVDRTVVGGSSNPGTVKVRTVGNRTKTMYIPLEEAEILPYALHRLGPTEVPNAGGLWAEFVDQFGDLPAVEGGGFNSAFDQFISAKGLDLPEGQLQDLKQFFAERQLKVIEDIDADLYKALRRRKQDDLTNKMHVDGQLAVQASENGWLVETVWNANRNKYEYRLRDIMDGTVTPSYIDESGLRTYIKEHPRTMQDFLEPHIDFPLAIEHLGLEGVGVQVRAIAAEGGIQFAPSAILQFLRPVTPRWAYVRNMNDAMIRTAPELYAKYKPGLYWEELRDAVTMSRIASDDFLRTGFVRPDGTRQKSLSEIIGGRKKLRARQEKYNEIVDTLQRPKNEWKSYGKQIHGLTDEEIAVVGDLRDYFNTLFEEVLVKSKHIDIDADRFLEDYFPHVWNMGKSDSSIKKVIEAMERAGKNPDVKTIRFIHEMRRSGRGVGYVRDPFQVALTYTRGAFAKSYMSEPFNNAKTMMRGLFMEAKKLQREPATMRAGKELEYLSRSMAEYLIATYGKAPEHYHVIGNTFKTVFKQLGVDVADELSEETFDRIINSLAMLNYGAFMGFRPVLALRNLTQTMVVTLPMVGPKYFLKGLKQTVTGGRKAWDEALALGVVPQGSIAAPMADRLSIESMKTIVGAGEDVGSKLLGRGLGAVQRAKRISEIGLGGELKVKVPYLKGEVDIPVGVYTRADHFNRMVSYHAQKERVLDAMNKWKGPSGHNIDAKFFEQAGLSQLGETHTLEFMRKLRESTGLEAAQWAGKVMANETQWIYQLGAGPALFTHGVGRLFGMYGTWPSWYGAHLARGLNRGTVRDKARFVGWTGAVVSAMSSMAWLSREVALASGQDVGVNLSRWSPMNSFTWSGSPFVDMLKDVTDIVGGGQGETQTAGRQLALARYGTRDVGNLSPIQESIPLFGAMDPRPGHGLDVENPYKAALSILGLFTPGGLAIKDLYSAMEKTKMGQSKLEIMLEASGFEPVSAYYWPSMQVDFNR